MREIATAPASDSCRTVAMPAAATLPACPFTGPNTESQEAFTMIADWGVAKNYRAGWLPQPHGASGAPAGVVPIDGEWQASCRMARATSFGS